MTRVAHKTYQSLLVGSLMALSLLFLSNTHAAPNQVRVINNTEQTIYIHRGGYSASVPIQAGKWKIFSYPFYVVPPGTKKRLSSSLLVATAGGRWKTTPNGYTYLDSPSLLICLDYQSPEHAKKTGNRKWTINRASGHQENCKVKGYHQPWYQPAN